MHPLPGPVSPNPGVIERDEHPQVTVSEAHTWRGLQGLGLLPRGLASRASGGTAPGWLLRGDGAPLEVGSRTSCPVQVTVVF